ncbi:hypothetical protein DDE83_000928 [Stemphylium lycopersici]|uniref:Uncharacterized protein n=1 Tax=Stemphylium lycopersici TaxID=183478 RepID=A0A364NEK0_STELY|nr:hypothetical protein DDE83_000928 [Stemphylium lycopersici]
MTDILTQQDLLSAPSSHQDIVSALLNDYGNSFGRGDTSPSSYSPVPALKELPPPPPRSDSIARKPLPATQRMDAKFQLRDDQDAPVSPASSVQDSPPRPRKRIVSRSLSRDSKPASLKLTISNGSTASIPPTPAFPVPSRIVPSSGPAEKDLPPSPPAKSERRMSVKEEEMGSKSSKQVKDLTRNDSLLSQGKASDRAGNSSNAAPPVVKRKAIAETGLKKFKSLAELGSGPRGRKGAPMPPTSVPRDPSVDSQQSDPASRKGSVDGPAAISKSGEAESEEQPRQMQGQLPPTPYEEKDGAKPLAPPKKVFTGLPSNPRVKAPASPLHMRGKSSTGFNVLKAMRPAPPVPTMDVQIITPEMTPSPTLNPNLAKNDSEISPVSPLPPPSEQSHLCSYEPAADAETQQAKQPYSAKLTPPHVPTPPMDAQHPMRTTSLDPPAPSPSFRPSSAPSRPTSTDLSDANLSPFPGPSIPSSPVDENGAPSATLPAEPATPPPFTPLTQHPIPLPISLVPQITKAQLHCYTGHTHNIWSNNLFQPMACMVCHENGKERKWACTWCQLRVCRGCSEELRRTPGRDLGVLLEVRRKVGEVKQKKEEQVERNPGILVQNVDGEERGM